MIVLTLALGSLRTQSSACRNFLSGFPSNGTANRHELGNTVSVTTIGLFKYNVSRNHDYGPRLQSLYRTMIVKGQLPNTAPCPRRARSRLRDKPHLGDGLKENDRAPPCGRIVFANKLQKSGKSLQNVHWQRCAGSLPCELQLVARPTGCS